MHLGVKCKNFIWNQHKSNPHIFPHAPPLLKPLKPLKKKHKKHKTLCLSSLLIGNKHSIRGKIKCYIFSHHLYRVGFII